MSKLTVLSVAYPLAPVGPDAVGGAEQILSQLDRALTRAGHRSLVIARADSAVAGALLPIPPVDGPITDAARSRIQQHVARALLAALDRWPIDLAHLHGLDCHAYLPPGEIPALVTLHLPPDWYRAALFAEPRPRLHLHAVSASQHRRCPPSPHLLPPIDNGVDLDFTPDLRSAPRRDHAVALGRICPEKGFDRAIEAAKLADVDLLLAGQVFPYPDHQRYFARQIEPRLDARRRFIGPVGGEEKRRLLAGARCLLAPSLAAETSSLVAMEALACGTPVIAHPAGALAEIVEHGRTGFLVGDIREMARAIRAAPQLDRTACRRAAEVRFPLSRMVARYLDLYRRLAAGAACGGAPA